MFVCTKLNMNHQEPNAISPQCGAEHFDPRFERSTPGYDRPSWMEIQRNKRDFGYERYGRYGRDKIIYTRPVETQVTMSQNNIYLFILFVILLLVLAMYLKK